MTQCKCCDKKTSEKNICDDCVEKINSLLLTDKDLLKYNTLFAIATFGSFLFLFLLLTSIITIYIALENNFSSFIDIILMTTFFLFIFLLFVCLLCRVFFKIKIKRRLKNIINF